MPKTNQKGRNKVTPYIRLHRGITSSEAWQSLSCEATRLLICIWERHNGTNNGQIGYGFREARKALRVGTRKVQRAFGDLQERGFIIERSPASFDWKTGAGLGKATEWELTMEPCDGKPAKATYRTWPEKQNTVTTVVTVGSHSGNRSRQNTSKPKPNGSYSGNRLTQKCELSGYHSGNTSNIPSGVAE